MIDDGRTIVALATPEGRGGLAVVRLSGPEAVEIARRVVVGAALAEPVETHRARLATLAWPLGRGAEAAGRRLDQALVLPLLAPASYTGEDTVEFSCHGGPMPARLVVAACIAAGARAAGAGEFTRRAFLNGKLSLTEAEAVADLIESEHALGARAALSQLRGGLRRRLEAIERPLSELLTGLEGSLEFIDDADQADGAPDAGHVGDVLAAALGSIDGLLALAPAGRRLRDGVQVVLVGPPNVGKSSLFNALVGEDRVIVDATPVTTRDVVSAELELEGVRCVVHDTAGLRDRADRIEAAGMSRTHATVARADIVLALRAADDADPGPGTPLATPEGGTVLPVVTKGDLAPGEDGLVTSSVTGAGLEDLRAALRKAVREGGLEEAAASGVMLNQRHLSRLTSAREAIAAAAASVDGGAEVTAGLVRLVLQDLGSVSGRVFGEQLLGEIFSRFCVGK